MSRWRRPRADGGPRAARAAPGGSQQSARGREDLKSASYELFIFAVSILSIVNLALYAILPWRSQSWWLIAFVFAPILGFGSDTYRGPATRPVTA